ncbi:FlgO family outer membrane protein [Paraglaciecola hydrolytica]|nr:FlgO family outer membrane protein [Paraglaciecola hydrolytica]
MKIIVKNITLIGVVTMMTACSSLYADKENERLCATESGQFYVCKDLQLSNNIVKQDASLFTPKLHFVQLNEYTQQMVMDLNSSLNNTVFKGTIAVASFVFRDESLRTTNNLGNELAEYFINDLQNIGLQVSDLSVTGTLDITDKGSFAFSRQQGDIFNYTEVEYVLTGTMIKTVNGLRVNARIIELSNKNVIASSSKIIPDILLAELL